MNIIIIYSEKNSKNIILAKIKLIKYLKIKNLVKDKENLNEYIIDLINILIKFNYFP